MEAPPTTVLPAADESAARNVPSRNAAGAAAISVFAAISPAVSVTPRRASRERNNSRALLSRWVVERTFGWLGRFRRLARDYERLAKVLSGWHWIAFLMLVIKQVGFQSQ